MHSPTIILVEPQSPGNIGMVCRAMGNFGAGDLRLVNPCDYLHPEAHRFAVGAAPLLGSARVYDGLAAAIADLDMTIAATRRTGKLRGGLRPVAEMAELVGAGEHKRVGLVFGREDAGLTTGEVALCSHGAFIPSDPACGSLNLAQAVLVFLYEFSRIDSPVGQDFEEEPPRQGELEEFFRQMEDVLSRIAFLNPSRPEGVMNTLRRIHQRANLDRRELSLLRGVWTQLAWSIRDWRGRKRGDGPESR